MRIEHDHGHIAQIFQDRALNLLLLTQLAFQNLPLLDLVAEQASQLFKFVLALGQSLVCRCPGGGSLDFQLGQEVCESFKVRFDESRGAVGYLAGQDHEDFGIFTEESGQGMDAFLGQGRVFAPFELAEIGVVDANALGHAADGISGVLCGQRLPALLDVTSEGTHVSIMK